jgi:hypothetical protein
MTGFEGAEPASAFPKIETTADYPGGKERKQFQNESLQNHRSRWTHIICYFFCRPSR